MQMWLDAWTRPTTNYALDPHHHKPFSEDSSRVNPIKGKIIRTQKELIGKIILARQFWVCLLYRSLILDTKEEEKKKIVHENHTVIE